MNTVWEIGDKNSRSQTDDVCTFQLSADCMNHGAQEDEMSERKNIECGD